MNGGTFEEWMEHIVRAFETAGVAVLVIGAIATIVRAALALLRGDSALAYRRAREGLGRTVLLGLEFLIIADIVLTITIDTTFESAASLALIVLIRTFLSFSIDVELDGIVPWGKRSEKDSHPT